MYCSIATATVFASLLLIASAEAGYGTKVPVQKTIQEFNQEPVQAIQLTGPPDKRLPEWTDWVRNTERHDAANPPAKLAIIACRVGGNT